MSKANIVASFPSVLENSISGRNMVINGGFQRCYRARRSAPDINIAGNNFITDRWKVNGYGTGGDFVAIADTAIDNSGAASGISEDGQQFAYLGYKTVNITPKPNYLVLFQSIEQTLISQLKWGTPLAKPAVISFRGRFVPVSTDLRLTHKISVALRSRSELAAGAVDPTQRSIVFDVELTKVADRYVIKIPPLTDGYDLSFQSGTKGLDIMFTVSSWVDSTNTVDVCPAANLGQWMDNGRFISENQPNLFDASKVGSTIQISDVQFELGDMATNFAYEDYSTLFLKCARYFYAVQGPTDVPVVTGTWTSAKSIVATIKFPLVMRDKPTVTHNLTDASFVNSAATADTWCINSAGLGYISKTSGTFQFTTGVTTERCLFRLTGIELPQSPNVLEIGSNKYIQFDAEIN